MRKFICRCIVIVWIIALQSGYALDFQWDTFTSTRNIRQMVKREDIIWCATEGGLLAFDVQTNTYSTYTNTEGLADIDVVDLVMDPNKNLWIGTGTGIIQRFDPDQMSWKIFDDFEGHEIFCLYSENDSLWVGLDIGVSLFLFSREEVKESYRRLGTFQVERAVGGIVIYQDSIWVSTEEGIAYASLAGKNLLDPNNWLNIDFSGNSQSEILPFLKWHQNNLYTIFNNTVYRIDNNVLKSIQNNLPAVQINQFVIIDSTLHLTTSSGIYQWDDHTWSRIHTQSLKTYSLLFDFDAFIVGTDNGIAYYYPQNDSLILFEPNCPASNYFTDLAVDQDGVLWCTSADIYASGGIFKYENGEWTTYSQSNVPVLRSNNYHAVMIDPDNNKWFGSWGGGLVKLSQDTIWEIFYPGNGYLSGISGNSNYAVVPDIAYDPVSNSVWLLNSEPVSGNGLVSIVDDTIWTYYNTPLSNNTYYVLEVDQYGRKWFGTYHATGYGVRVYDDNNTPSDKSDDEQLQSLTKSADELHSNVITSLVLDRDGLMWIGSSKGIHYWPGGPDNGVEYRLHYQGSYIYEILVDGVNNIWVAHGMGIGIRMNTDYQWINIDENNSKLVSNTVRVMALDPNSGFVYIGTEKGLSRAKTSYSEPLENPEPLFIYPNPYLPKKHANVVIDRLSKDVEVGIYTLSGFRIRYYDDNQVAGRQLLWDGKNSAGQVVASGVYIIVAQNSDGNTQHAKITIVR